MRRKHLQAKPLRGFKGGGVLEVVEDFDGNTFRCDPGFESLRSRTEPMRIGRKASEDERQHTSVHQE
jgi:hypothetical protein